ncbi:hypothetical protein DMT42_25045 [Streptomyces actuosus]|uniref:Uncharacterized protein n=1 Tax=Streptomyces actuosus TaxID=1885 RepID=A0A2U9P692_STRAS|nr:hypothetical protein DMT42_25045 [Streptomyces actuosus]
MLRSASSSSVTRGVPGPGQLRKLTPLYVTKAVRCGRYGRDNEHPCHGNRRPAGVESCLGREK